MSRYLRIIRASRYGALSDFEAGPFSPGLNVVYGPNEAGKSTLASLVGGILFGWEEAHGVRNTYRPAEGERRGSLEFAERFAESAAGFELAAQAPGWTAADAEPGSSAHAPSGKVSLLSRDEGSVQGDLSLVEDIDRDTYKVVFSLTSEELRSLRGSSDLTARLLTAGSGTASSPSSAFVEIEQRIAALTAPAGLQGKESIFQLEEELEAKRLQVKDASDKAQLLVQEDLEMRELSSNRVVAANRASELDRELEALIAKKAELEAVEARVTRCQAELGELRESRAALAPLEALAPVLDESDERVLRDQLDELAERHEKASRIVDSAKENSAASSAAYEALLELDEEGSQSGSLKKKALQSGLLALLTLVFVAAGLPLFVHGRQIASLSFTALGIGFVVLAFFLAAAAIVVLFRNPRAEDVVAARRQDAQWVMLQDRKKLDASTQDKAQVEAEIIHVLENAGLEAAEGSVRRARMLLDEMAQKRARYTAEEQRIAALDLRIGALGKELVGLLDARSSLLAECDSLDEYDSAIRDMSGQRDALRMAAEDMSQRFGELSGKLEEARHDRSFHEAKLEHQQLRTRLREAKHELICLLLAKRMLERSITAWEGQSQPEVYAQAGRLLSLITDGKWTGVSTSATGSLVAVANDGEERDPRHLSLGTCQQLYLALRIALLLSAEEVGSSVPVLADDILVNFDAARCRGAARALVELSRKRQVIVFTCHESTLSVLQEADPNTNCINIAP